MSDLLIAPAYAEIAALKRHFQLLNGSPEALQYLLVSTPTPTGAQLETWLTTPANLTAFQQLVSSPAGAAAVAASSTAMAAVAASSTAMNAVAASSTAMAAVIASSTAMNAVAASSTAMAAVIASSTAMNAVAASSTAMNAVAASSTAMAAVAASSTAMAAVLNSATARKAVYDSDTAWNAIAGSATAKAALLASSVEHSTNSTSHVYPPGSGAGVRAALLQQRCNGYYSNAGANADTYSTTSTSYIDRYVRVTGLTHRINNNSYYSYIKYIIMQ